MTQPPEAAQAQKIQRVSPFMYVRPRRKIHIETITDDDHPEIALKVALRKTDAADAGVGIELARKAIEKYVTGNKAEKIKALPFPLPGDEPLPMTESLCFDVATVCVMQVHIDPSVAPYTFDEMVALSVTFPDAWSKIQAFANRVQRGDEEKNSSREGTGQPSDSPSTTSEPSPSSSSAPTPLPGAPTSAPDTNAASLSGPLPRSNVSALQDLTSPGTSKALNPLMEPEEIQQIMESPPPGSLPTPDLFQEMARQAADFTPEQERLIEEATQQRVAAYRNSLA